MEGYRDDVKQRGIDTGYKVLQIFIDPFKLKMSESGEDVAYWR